MPSRSRSMVACSVVVNFRYCWWTGLSLTSASLKLGALGGSTTLVLA